MDKTNEMNVKENKLIKWFKKMLQIFKIGKRRQLPEALKKEQFYEYQEPPKTAYKIENKRNEFIEDLKNQTEKNSDAEDKVTEKSEEDLTKINVPTKESFTDEYFIHRIIEEYNRENGRITTEKDLEFVEIHPQYYIKNNEDYLLDYNDKTMSNYTKNASTAFAMIDKNENKVITAVGVADGKARYIKGNFFRIDNKEYKGAEMQIDFRKLGFKEDKSDPHNKNINELAYFAFSKELDKQILNERIQTKDKDPLTMDK